MFSCMHFHWKRLHYIYLWIPIPQSRFQALTTAPLPLYLSPSPMPLCSLPIPSASILPLLVTAFLSPSFYSFPLLSLTQPDLPWPQVWIPTDQGPNSPLLFPPPHLQWGTRLTIPFFPGSGISTPCLWSSALSFWNPASSSFTLVFSSLLLSTSLLSKLNSFWFLKVNLKKKLSQQSLILIASSYCALSTSHVNLLTCINALSKLVR